MFKYRFTIFIIFLFIIPLGTTAQTTKEQRRIDRAERKELKKKEHQEKFAELNNMVYDSSFIVQAYTIVADNLNTFQVNPNINFFMIQGDQFTLQTGNDIGLGFNGLGGITIEGHITDYAIVETKEGKPLRIRMSVMSTVLGHSTIYIILSGNDNGQVRINDNWGNQLLMRGEVQNVGANSIYKGNRIF